MAWSDSARQASAVVRRHGRKGGKGLVKRLAERLSGKSKKVKEFKKRINLANKKGRNARARVRRFQKRTDQMGF